MSTAKVFRDLREEHRVATRLSHISFARTSAQRTGQKTRVSAQRTSVPQNKCSKEQVFQKQAESEAKLGKDGRSNGLARREAKRWAKRAPTSPPKERQAPAHCQDRAYYHRPKLSPKQAQKERKRRSKWALKLCKAKRACDSCASSVKKVGSPSRVGCFASMGKGL